LELTGNIAYG